MFHPRDGAYSVWLFFAPGGEFRSWYVNLEEPGTRWDDGVAAGIDTIDYDLDIVVAPDRSWHWKDEDEFAYHLAYPDAYWVDDPAAVWAEGKRVVTLIEAGAVPVRRYRHRFPPRSGVVGADGIAGRVGPGARPSVTRAGGAW